MGDGLVEKRRARIARRIENDSDLCAQIVSIAPLVQLYSWQRGDGKRRGQATSAARPHRQLLRRTKFTAALANGMFI